MSTWADALTCNADCGCWPIERNRIVEALPEKVQALLDNRHANLFAETGVFVAQSALDAMTDQVAAIERVAQSAAFKVRVLDDLMNNEHQTDTRGLLMGYDFHLAAEGPRLIEINTNAGGAFLALHMTETLDVHKPFKAGFDVSDRLTAMFTAEWRLAGRSGVPTTIVIVDEAPESEYLYSDMQLAASLLRTRFEHVYVAGINDLSVHDGRLWVNATEDATEDEGASARPVDLVYNRLTDFGLEAPVSAVLRRAWFDDLAVVSPSPRHHALLANKLNLELLGDEELVEGLELSASDKLALSQIPTTVRVSRDASHSLWQNRRGLFFKPAAGYAGRMAYRGAKLTRGRFQRMIDDLDRCPYVAQALVKPATRLLPSRSENGPKRLKFDVRVFSYNAQPLLLAARVYDGQTTNFRTPGGGFAPVAVMQEAPQGSQSRVDFGHCLG